MGKLTIVWLIGSGVGVMAAPSTNARTNAYFLKRARRCAETTPSLARKNITIGSSNANPTQNRKLETKSIYRSADHCGAIWSARKPARKRVANGSVRK